MSEPAITPRCPYCAHHVHGPAGCIVRAGLKTPQESWAYVVDGLDREIARLLQERVHFTKALALLREQREWHRAEYHNSPTLDARVDAFLKEHAP